MIIDDNTSEPDFKLALPVTDESALKRIWTFDKIKSQEITYAKNAAKAGPCQCHFFHPNPFHQEL